MGNKKSNGAVERPHGPIVMLTKFVSLLAVLLTALALVPGGAHLLEQSNKMRMGRDDYFLVQSIYRGWALAGVVLLGALAANIYAAVLRRGEGASAWASAGAAILLVATLVIFLIWTLPANRATSNWTVPTADWIALRRQWEFSHAVNAVITFLALCCAAASPLLAAPRR
jgi:hypothetical protein